MAIIKEIASILKEIYRKGWVVYEVNAAIRTEYYEDETVPLRDLLTPNKSSLYKTQKFIASGAQPGVFKKAFGEQLLEGNYPNLIKVFGQPPPILSRTMDEWPSVDTTNDIWTDQYGYSIYFPYSEYFPLVSPFDPNINTVNGQLVTIVGADREADSGPGQEPYIQSDPNLPQCPDNICYTTVTVDDNYAENHPTHIIGVGVEPTIVNSNNQQNQVYVVFLGDVKCTHQYDRFISFTGNGGASELRFIRGSNYLELNDNLQITNPQDVISVNVKRKDIRQGNWKTINSVWDSDWEINDLEQVFGIYEEDNQNSQTFTGSLQTTLTIPGSPSPGTVVANRGYSLTIISDDDIIRQLNWNRTSFYQYNQGNLNNGCGTRNGWTIYDCNTYVRYTLPTQ